MKLFLRLLGLDNRNKIIYELMGNPGSGKTTIIDSYNFYDKKRRKMNSLMKKVDFLSFVITNPVIVIYTAFSLLKISNLFLHPHLKYNLVLFFKRQLKIYKILLLMWYKIKKTKSRIIITESIIHQIAQLGRDKKLLIENIIKSYGYPKLCIIYLETPIDISMNRMTLRGDKINKKNSDVFIRYQNSYEILRQIFDYSLSNFKNINYFSKPIYLNGLESIKFNINFLKNQIKTYSNSF